MEEEEEEEEEEEAMLLVVLAFIRKISMIRLEMQAI